MSRPLEGRVALVTGAAGSGIGRATAHRLAADGANVILTDIHEARTQEAAAEVAAASNARILGLRLDVSDRSEVDDVIIRATSELGAIDILVNNAAINVLGPVHEMAPEDWDRVVDVDLSAPWYLMRQVIPGMVAARRGSIVNVTSVAAWIGSGGEGPYAAAKAALQSLTRSVAHELGPHNVRCNAVAPGIVWTRFTEKYRDMFIEEEARTPLRRLGQPEDVADVIAFLVSADSRYMTGEVVNVSGGWHMRA